MKGIIARTLYRNILKEIRALSPGSHGPWIHLHEPLDSARMGWKWYPGGSLRTLPTQFEVLQRLLPLGESSTRLMNAWKEKQENSFEEGHGFTRTELTDLTRAIFKTTGADASSQQQFDEAMSTIKAISDQRTKTECSSFATDQEHGLSVRAMSCYSPDERPEGHLFAYRVTVKNNGPTPLKLVGRHWFIIDSNGDVAAELPESVRYLSTEAPALQSGQGLEYHSGVELCTGFGKMSGFMYFEDPEGNRFHVPVEPFSLKADFKDEEEQMQC